MINILNETYLNRRKVLLIFPIFLIAIIAIGMISVVSAKDITIGPKTSGGLKKAIDKAENGDTILLKNGVYKGANNIGLIINKKITIEGKGNNVVIDAQRKNQTFNCYNKVTFKNLKIKNGYVKNGDGAAIISYGDLTVSKCTFTNNQAGAGGAIMIGTLTQWSTPTTLVLSCTFTNNQAREGGAIVLHGQSSVKNCTFKNNWAIDNGGAIYSNGESTVNKCTFTTNKAKYGGAIYCFPFHNTTIKITNSNFNKNIAGKVYNAIHNQVDQQNKVIKQNVLITPKDGTKVKK